MNADSQRPPASTPARPPSPAQHLVPFVGLDRALAAGLADGLSKAGVRGLWFDRIEQALAAAAHAHFDAAVLQLKDAVPMVARQLGAWRQGLACPLLLLAEVDDEVDEIMALELGADRLLQPHVSPRRLRAHLSTLLRRGTDGAGADLPGPPAAPLEAGGWTLDPVHNRLCRDDAPGPRQVTLTELQAGLLRVLMTDLGRVVPRSRLLAAVARGRELQARSVDVYVARLRQRLLDEHVDDLLLDSVRGRGYLLRVGAPASPARLWPALVEPLSPSTANAQALATPG